MVFLNKHNYQYWLCIAVLRTLPIHLYYVLRRYVYASVIEVLVKILLPCTLILIVTDPCFLVSKTHGALFPIYCSERLFLFSCNGLRKAVSLNHWQSLIFQNFSEFSTWKTCLLHKLDRELLCRWLWKFLVHFSISAFRSCAAWGSELLLFGSGSRQKCPCFGTEIPFLLWKLSCSSSCFLSITLFPIFCIAFLVTRVCCSLCKCSIAGRNRSGSRLESICFSQPPICSKATALHCYQIILFQKLLIKTWVIGQVTKDFLFIFLNNGKYQIATICSSYSVSLFQSCFVGTGFNSAGTQEDDYMFSCQKNKIIKIFKFLY